MSSKMVLCGLGNSGELYQATRHNLGFWLLDFISERFGGKWSRPCSEYSQCKIKLNDDVALLVKPQTYMNLSGKALLALGKREAVVPERLLVLCDDTALPLGQIRLRRGGGDGGHKGLKSVISCLNTEDFHRLRLGVGPVPDGVDYADFVLSPFLEGEKNTVDVVIQQAAKCVATYASSGIEAAMNRFNVKIPPESTEPADPRPPDDDQV